MPLTFSHPAAILLINKKWKKYFSFTGLVLGSMSPDFEYFLNFKPLAIIGHTFLGFLILNLPLCFVLAYLFHKFIKKPLILHLPTPISTWYSNFALKTWRLNSFRDFWIFIYSALFGMLTHIVWDSFTHIGGGMVNLLPFLSIKIGIFGYSIPMFKLLQHSSSVFGAIFILLYFYKEKHTSNYIKNIPAKLKVTFFVLIIANGGLFGFGIINFSFHDSENLNLGILVVTVINCMFFGLILTSFISKLWTGAAK